MTDAAHFSAMFQCRRDAEGRIVALAQQALNGQEMQASDWQSVGVDDPDVAAFMHSVSGVANPLSETDGSMARILEDLINVLIQRGVMQFTDLPQAAQVRLLERSQTRSHLAHSLLLLPDDGDRGLI